MLYQIDRVRQTDTDRQRLTDRDRQVDDARPTETERERNEKRVDIISLQSNQIEKMYNVVLEYLRMVRKFVNATKCGKSSKPAPSVIVLKQMLQTPKIQIAEVDYLFSVLHNTAFLYEPNNDTNQPSTSTKSSSVTGLFKTRDVEKWSKQRKELKRHTVSHTDIIVELMDWQQACWKTRDKMKQYVLMLECAKMSLPYYIDKEREFKARKYSIKQLKKDVKYWQKRHTRVCGEYLKLLSNGDKLWKEMSKISWELEHEIQGIMKEKLSKALDDLSQMNPTNTIRKENAELVSKAIYDSTCKTYTVFHPPYDPSSAHFNTKIHRPSLENSLYYHLQSQTRPYHELMTFRCTVEKDTGDVERKMLRVKPGDKLILKFASPDQLYGFGYTKSPILSIKKWGFVYLDNISIESTYQNFITE
ncbi:hypothetical protein ACF0H5_020016 [Mactra antiquata]